MNSEVLIKAKGIIKHFEGGTVTALDSVSLEIGKAETVSVVGPSGSGKTTLLQILGTLRQPDEGELLFEGRSYPEVHDTAKFRNRFLGFVFQSPLLLPVLTAVENVMIPLVQTHLPPKEMRRRAEEILDMARSGHLVNRRAANLSAGERQRISVCRAFVGRPAFVLADEPTANLDRGNREAVLGLMTLFNQTFQTAIAVATHDPEVRAWAQRGIYLVDGRIGESGEV
jgi:lipoprotein-releasing system ATP-binding protein